LIAPAKNLIRGRWPYFHPSDPTAACGNADVSPLESKALMELVGHQLCPSVRPICRPPHGSGKYVARSGRSPFPALCGPYFLYFAENSARSLTYVARWSAHCLEPTPLEISHRWSASASLSRSFSCSFGVALWQPATTSRAKTVPRQGCALRIFRPP